MAFDFGLPTTERRDLVKTKNILFNKKHDMDMLPTLLEPETQKANLFIKFVAK